jgi:hypothetical protein
MDAFIIPTEFIPTAPQIWWCKASTTGF